MKSGLGQAALPPSARATTLPGEYCELRELEPLERAAASFPPHLAPIPQPRAPTPGTHICSGAVGSIDKAKVLGFCQDHEGAHFSWP